MVALLLGHDRGGGDRIGSIFGNDQRCHIAHHEEPCSIVIRGLTPQHPAGELLVADLSRKGRGDANQDGCRPTASGRYTGARHERQERTAHVHEGNIDEAKTHQDRTDQSESWKPAGTPVTQILESHEQEHSGDEACEAFGHYEVFVDDLYRIPDKEEGREDRNPQPDLCVTDEHQGENPRDGGARQHLHGHQRPK